MSYGGSFSGSYPLPGVYSGRILKGVKPADLPGKPADESGRRPSAKTQWIDGAPCQTHPKPGRYGVGGGLYLAVKDTGAKSWVFLWKRNGRRRARGLGSADTVSLVEARELAADARKAVREGRDPASARAERGGVPTFGDCAGELASIRANSVSRNPRRERR